MLYEVWNEGYQATGERAQAQYLGKYHGETFPEACKAAMEDKHWDLRFYTEPTNSYWGCRFFDNETAARKNYG